MPSRQAFSTPCFHRRHKDAVHVLAGQRFGEFDAGIARQRLDLHPDLGKLPRAAGLFLVAVFGIAGRS